jgi:hypothetical protein
MRGAHFRPRFSSSSCKKAQPVMVRKSSGRWAAGRGNACCSPNSSDGRGDGTSTSQFRAGQIGNKQGDPDIS